MRGLGVDGKPRRTFMQMRKQDDICGRGVPALNSVGLACVNQRSLSIWYVWMALSRSSWWMPTWKPEVDSTLRGGLCNQGQPPPPVAL